MKKYKNYSREELQNIIESSSTYKEALQKIGYSRAKSSLLLEIAEEYQIDISKLKKGAKQIYQNFTDDQLKKIILSSSSYKEALQKIGYVPKTNQNIIIKEIAERLNISLSHFKHSSSTDLKGKRFNYWTVIQKDNHPKDNRNSYWICKCDCGNVRSLPYSNIVNNKSLSCGCKKYSKGEILISNILKRNNIVYIEQYSPQDIKSYKGYPLFFDFYLPEYHTFIEYQGEQHYKKTGYLGGEERFIRQQNNDEIKRKYCNDNNYFLIEIPYTNYNKINDNYIKEILMACNHSQIAK